MDPDLAPAKFGGAAPPGKERTHVVGMYAFDGRQDPINIMIRVAGRMANVVEHSTTDYDILGTNPSHVNAKLANLRVSYQTHPLQTACCQITIVAVSVKYSSKDQNVLGSNPF